MSTKTDKKENKCRKIKHYKRLKKLCENKLVEFSNIRQTIFKIHKNVNVLYKKAMKSPAFFLKFIFVINCTKQIMRINSQIHLQESARFSKNEYRSKKSVH